MSTQQETLHAVTADFDTIFSWDYERSRGSLVKLYEKAKTSQWNATTDLDWSIDVDPEKIGRELGGGGPMRFQALAGRRRLAGEALRREGVAQGLGRDPELAALAVHARRAGRVAVHRAHRRDRPVDRRQVLRGDAGDGRGPPRRGVRRATSTRSSAASTASTTTSSRSSTTSSPIPAGTSPTSACRSWSRVSRSRRSACCTRSRPSRCSRSCCAT